MPSTVKGVIARTKGAPVELVDVIVPDPGPGEAVVKIEACGVCHTDVHYREGGINDEFPFLLGHEAAGVVEAVGEGVTNVAPGVCEGQAAVLLQHPQRQAEDDLDRWHGALAGVRDRRVHREDPGCGRSMHQGRRASRCHHRGSAGLRGDGGVWCCGQHWWCQSW